MSIDITYIPQHNGTRLYLFAIKYLFDKAIIDYELIMTISFHFIIRCLKRANKNNNTKNLTIHSDQGVHFTCKEYLYLLEQNNINLSHLRNGNYHDNAPIESFFSLYKKEYL